MWIRTYFRLSFLSEKANILACNRVQQPFLFCARVEQKLYFVQDLDQPKNSILHIRWTNLKILFCVRVEQNKRIFCAMVEQSQKIFCAKDGHSKFFLRWSKKLTVENHAPCSWVLQNLLQAPPAIIVRNSCYHFGELSISWKLFVGEQCNLNKIIGLCLYLPGLVRTQCPLSLAESQPEKCHWSSKAFSENIKIKKKKSKIKIRVFKDLQMGHLTSHRRRVHLLKLSLEGKDNFL